MCVCVMTRACRWSFLAPLGCEMWWRDGRALLIHRHILHMSPVPAMASQGLEAAVGGRGGGGGVGGGQGLDDWMTG